MTKLQETSALTDQEIIDKIAVDVMRWEKDGKEVWFDHPNDEVHIRWNPLTNWNHWREVEERVMENRPLSFNYFNALVPKSRMIQADAVEDGCFADLPTRCRALISALDSLKKT